MKVITARNVHQALPEALYQLYQDGVSRDSRNGPVLKFPEPVTTVYLKPAERVLFWPQRDANPFFHLVESLWMLAGRNDVGFVASYVARMKEFSDDGKTFHGAYGFRWREHFGFDQLQSIIDTLRKNPDDRRQVLSMWDAGSDLGKVGKDFPCNLQALFSVADDGRVDMLVTNRSNDLVWGCYGANAVHFSVLHEYIARSLGREQGIYRQVSNNLHAYLSTFEQVKELSAYAPDAMDPHRWAGRCPYNDGLVETFPLMSTELETWNADLEMFFSEPNAVGFRDPFFRRVAIPMARAHFAYKNGGADRFDLARAELEHVWAKDWKLAAAEWIERRREKAAARRARAQDDGPDYSAG